MNSADSAKPTPVEIVKADPWSDALHGMLGVSGGLLRNDAEDQIKKNAFKSLLGGGFGEKGGVQKATKQVDIEYQRDARMAAKYKPESQKFTDEIGILQKSLAENGIDQRIYTLAMGDLLKEAGSKLGENRLPTAQEYGSAELAKSLAQATAGTSSVTVEQLLTRQLEYEKQHLEETRKLVAAAEVPKTPPVIKMPAQ